VIGILAILFMVFLPGFLKLHKLCVENLQHQSRIKMLEERNEELKTELAKMRTQPDYIEQKARNKLGIIKKGEVIY